MSRRTHRLIRSALVPGAIRPACKTVFSERWYGLLSFAEAHDAPTCGHCLRKEEPKR